MNRAERRANKRGRTTLLPPPRKGVPGTGTPKEWFDQFPGLEPGSVWTNDQWCPRHWAPCPLLGYQGMQASRLLMDFYMKELKPANVNSPRAINRDLAKQGALCCKAGDERMYVLWGMCEPNQ